MQQMQHNFDDRQYRRAFACVRVAKNWFWWLILLAVIIDLGTFITVRFWPVLNNSKCFQSDLAALRHAEPTPAASPQAETQPVTQLTEPINEPSNSADWLYRAFGAGLAAARSIGLLCAVLLWLSLLLSLGIALVGRLGDVGHLTGALLWSLVLAILFVPWDVVFGAVTVPGVLFGRTELIAKTAEVTWGASGVSWAHQVLYFARFAAYPLLALVLWFAVQVKYALACREVSVVLESE
ncbi:MAG: hypothetical protein HQ546_04225 [Planctomycetes bacterium]|nr:hypothetical protein [Planctomycetota bacterium]